MDDLKKLFKFAKPYTWMLILSGVFMGIVTILDVFRLSAMVPFIDRVFTNKPILFTGNKLPAFLEAVLNRLNSLAPMQVLYLLLIVVPTAIVIRAIFEFAQSYMMADVGQKVIRDVRNQIYAKLQSLSLDYFVSKRSGELISRITNDVKLIENAVSYALTDLVYQSFEMVAYTTLAFFINWRLALITLVIFPLVVVPIAIIGKILRKLSKKSQEKMADINSLLVETFIGVRIVKAFGMENKEIAKFEGQNHGYYKLAMKAIKRTLIIGILMELVGVGAALFVMFYAGRQVLDGRLSFGAFALFMAALLSLIKPFKKLSQVNSILQQAIAAVKRIYEILDAQPLVKEAVDADLLPPLKGKITLKNVTFGYGDKIVLDKISLENPVGSTLAIVGPSGVGKTTLVDLIPRFYDPIDGEIFFDDWNIRHTTIKSLRDQIGIVTQETILFNDTIRANIAYGRPEATTEEVEEAARQAYAHDFILRFPQKYDTVIGDRGTKLSGGEKQRLAIARALLKNPPVLILDEATSQLDTESERTVQQALERLMQGRTVFVIAHRLSTVKSASNIIVLDKGKIVEQGTHQKLLEKNGLYKRLYSMQEFGST